MPGPSLADRRTVTARHVRLAKMFGQNKRRRPMPAARPPKLLEREYGAALVAYLAPRIRRAFTECVARLPAIVARARAALKHDRRDSASDEVDALLAEARARLGAAINPAEIEALAEKFAAQVSTYQRIQLTAQTRAALGVEVIPSDSKLPALIDGWTSANVSLIKNLPGKIAVQVEEEVTRAVAGGELSGDLAEVLEGRFKFAEDRAALIARDQIGKLYGQLNASRQQDLGVEKFAWTTSGDERVRDEHVELDGQVFSYDDPPSEGLPGEPILCRCWAEPIFDDVTDEADDDGSDDDSENDTSANDF